MFLTIKKKFILLFTAFFVFVFTFGFFITKITVNANIASPLGITVVIDAGHGGKDGGSVGTTTGVIESELNLQYSKTLEKYLTNFGFDVVQTRMTPQSLCSDDSTNFKTEDMKLRKEVIENSNAQILISIHMNKFTNSTENGPQVFYREDNENSKPLADGIRDMFKANFENARELTLSGDYYILNCTNIPGVIVECGFLSNPEEEQNLQKADYQEKICYSIYCGIIKYFKLVSY